MDTGKLLCALSSAAMPLDHASIVFRCSGCRQVARVKIRANRLGERATLAWRCPFCTLEKTLPVLGQVVSVNEDDLPTASAARH